MPLYLKSESRNPKLRRFDMCRMAEFVVREAICPNLQETVKESVIREMVKSLQETGHFAGCETDEIVKAILRREQLGSTGIGRHIAIPHAKHSSLDKLVGTVGLSQTGVQFDSIDAQPVHVLVLLISPKDKPGDHLRALENVVKSMRNQDFVDALRRAQTKDEV